MSLIVIVFWVVLLLFVGYVVVFYNGLVWLKYVVGKVWVNIDVFFKQCYDELLKLVEVCK